MWIVLSDACLRYLEAGLVQLHSCLMGRPALLLYRKICRELCTVYRWGGRSAAIPRTSGLPLEAQPYTRYVRPGRVYQTLFGCIMDTYEGLTACTSPDRAGCQMEC